MSRGLGVYGRGEYYLPLLAAQTVLTFANLSLEQANVFLYGHARVTLARLSGQNTFVALAMGSLGAGAVYAAPRLMPELFRDTPRTLLLLAGLTLPFGLAAQYASGLLTIAGRIVAQLRLAALVALLQVGLIVLLFITGSLTAVSVLAVNLIAAVLTAFLMTGALRQGFRPRCDVALLSEGLRQAFVLHLGTALLFLHLRVDMFMVKAISGTAALGLYSLAVMLAETVLLGTDALAAVVLPRQVGKTVDDSARLSLRAIRISVVIGLSLASAWLAVGWLLIRISFGRAFEPAFWMLAALLPGMIFTGAQRVCGGSVLQTGRPGRISLIQGVSLAINVVLNWWLIHVLGPVGASVASSVSYGCGALLFASWIARLAGAPLVEALPTLDDCRILGRAALTLARGWRTAQSEHPGALP